MAYFDPFEGLARQEMERPIREQQIALGRMTLANLKQEMEAKAADRLRAEETRRGLAGLPTTTPGRSLTDIGMTPQSAEMAMSPPMAGAAAPTFQPESMVEAPRPLNLQEQMMNQYNFLSTKDPVQAKIVFNEMMKVTTDTANVYKTIKQSQGKKAADQWLDTHPYASSFIGKSNTLVDDPEFGTMMRFKDDQGNVIPNVYGYFDSEGKLQTKEVKPEKEATYTPTAVDKIVDAKKRAYKEKTGKEMSAEDEATLRTTLLPRSRREETGHSKPRFVQYSDANGKSKMVDVNDAGERLEAEAQGWQPGAPAKLNSAQAKQLTDLKVMRDKTIQLKNAVKDNYLGVVSGSGLVGGVTSYFDKDEAYFRRVANDLADVLLRARSGAAITEKEYARLSKLMPTPSMSRPQFDAAYQGFTEELDSIEAGVNESVARAQRPMQGKKGAKPAPKSSGRFTVEEVK